MTTVTAREAPANVRLTGLGWALLSALSFGLSGPLAKSLLEAGWSPGAAVLFRIGGAALVLTVPCVVLMRSWRPTAASARYLFAYGSVAVAGAQFCYFSAVQHLSVGVALLLEYSAPVLLIGWAWLRRGQRPTLSILSGAALALAGLALVLDIGSDVRLNPVGIAWGLGAAVCLCFYFVLSEGHPAAAPPLVTTAVGTGVGALMIGLAGVVGLLPLEFTAAPTTLAGHAVSWLLPAGLLVVVSTVVAYLTGIIAIRRLGSTVGSFVALSEVLFAVLAAIALLGQVPTAGQAFGGALVIAGIVLVQRRTVP